jgi:hypothetical protein
VTPVSFQRRRRLRVVWLPYVVMKLTRASRAFAEAAPMPADAVEATEPDRLSVNGLCLKLRSLWSFRPTYFELRP